MILASVQVFVKWEPSKRMPREFITKLKVVKDCTLIDPWKLIEINLDEDTIKQGFTFSCFRKCGWVRLADIQEEIISICGAAHIPNHPGNTGFGVTCQVVRLLELKLRCGQWKEVIDG
ncbi:hypothetical protein IFM89_033631, partial [Coptis chinensis]